MEKKKPLTESIEDYLEAIYILELEGKPLKSTSVAENLKVSKPAVNKALNELISRGFISKEAYKEIEFTALGRTTAQSVYHKHTTIKKFLLSLGVSEENASIDCCHIEHAISDETFQKILESVEKDSK